MFGETQQGVVDNMVEYVYTTTRYLPRESAAFVPPILLLTGFRSYDKGNGTMCKFRNQPYLPSIARHDRQGWCADTKCV